MHPGHDVALKIVLEVRKFSGEIPHVVIVDERDGSHRVAVFAADPFLRDQLFSDQVTKRLRPRRISTPPYDLVELIEQMMIERNTEPNELFHGGVPRI